jgi:transcription elongation factor SPT6
VFEDLDEIIARYVQPMAAQARDILNYKYYVDSEGGRREIMDKILTDDKRKQPSRQEIFFLVHVGKLIKKIGQLRLSKY